jgi:hypothetical protein
MPQLSFGGRQASANFPQRLSPAQLAKQHGHELIPTSEAARMPFGFVLLDEGFKLQPGKQLQQLRKNAAYSIQAAVSDPEGWFFSGNPIQVSVFRR